MPDVNYYARQQAKQARYSELAASSAARSADLLASAHATLDAIPFGQPILVGHHSERAHRSALARANDKIRKAYELEDRAAHYQRKADSPTEAISSDAPDALDLLKSKLEAAISLHSRMKADREIPSFALRNSSGRIRALRQRIEQLEKLNSLDFADIVTPHYSLTLNKEDNRLTLTFAARQSDDVTARVKRAAFKWSPTRSAWVRQLTGNALYSARHLTKDLDAALNAAAA